MTVRFVSTALLAAALTLGLTAAAEPGSADPAGSATRAVKVQVVTGSGVPLVTGLVTMRVPPAPRDIELNGNGVASWGAAPRTEFDACARLFVSQSEVCTRVPPGTSATTATITVRGATGVSGTVVRRNGEPVSDVQVDLQSGTEGGLSVVSQSHPNGTFSALGLTPGPYSLFVLGSERNRTLTTFFGDTVRKPDQVLLDIKRGVVRTPTIEAVPAAVLTGLVLNQKGEPAAGVRVMASNTDRWGTDGATTAADGTYRIEGLASGPVELWASRDSTGAQSYADVTARQGAVVTVPTMKLALPPLATDSATAALSPAAQARLAEQWGADVSAATGGLVVGPAAVSPAAGAVRIQGVVRHSGAGVEGVTVFAYSPGYTTAQVLTDADGAYSLPLRVGEPTVISVVDRYTGGYRDAELSVTVQGPGSVPPITVN